MTMDQPSANYEANVTEAFATASHKHAGGYVDAWNLIGAFVVRFYPVLRHYRPEIVGQCLALSYDAPELGRSSELHGFGMDMKAGAHPGDRESGLGSFRDDGSYLAILAFDFFEGRLR